MWTCSYWRGTNWMNQSPDLLIIQGKWNFAFPSLCAISILLYLDLFVSVLDWVNLDTRPHFLALSEDWKYSVFYETSILLLLPFSVNTFFVRSTKRLYLNLHSTPHGYCFNFFSYKKLGGGGIGGGSCCCYNNNWRRWVKLVIK